MKPESLTLLVVLALCCGGAGGLRSVAGSPASAAEPAWLSVGVFDFESKDEAVRDLGPKVATLINARLSADPQLVTVERAELEKVLSEQELGLSGMMQPGTTAKVGQWIGAKVLVTGRVFEADQELVLVAKIIGTDTSRVYGELVKGPHGAGLIELADELAGKIGVVLAEKRDTLVATVASHEERIRALVGSLSARGGRRPAVSVTLGERHVGAPVLDPAAETELTRILQMAGFEVVDARSRTKPGIEISGEAFSALGLRKGNLVACRARIELKVHEVEARKLLLADRQTSVAVDIAEATAAKSALEEAALALAERILPHLVR